MKKNNSMWILWRCMWEWRYSSTHSNFDTRSRWAVSFVS